LIQPTGRERQSLLSIQILRAAAALAVSADHIVGYEFATQYALPDALPHFKFGRAGVDLFFVISGFVMVYSSERYFGRAKAPQEFFLRRLARIVPLYWVTTTIILIYLLVQYHDLARVKFSLDSVVASYLSIPAPQLDGYMAPVHGVGWTLNYEMFFYGCFCFALLFSRRTGVLLLAAIFAAFVSLNYFVSLPNPIGYWADSLILEFVFGMTIALAVQAGVRIPGLLTGAFVIVGVSLLVASDRWPEVPRVIALGLPSALIVGALALANHSAKGGPAERALSFLGDASYSLYLVHPLAITLPRRLFPHFVHPATSPWLYAGLLMLTALIAAVIVHVLFERPITRLLQRRIASMSHRARPEAAPAGVV
jgi:exopolysaccharide production protein ExoZ